MISRLKGALGLTKKRTLYLIGVFMLGLLTEPAKKLIPNGWVVLLLAIIYLLLLRLLAEHLDRP
jgi:hypothetical protein